MQPMTNEQKARAAKLAVDIVEVYKREEKEVAMQAVIDALALTLRVAAPSYAEARSALDLIAVSVDAKLEAMFKEPLPPRAN